MVDDVLDVVTLLAGRHFLAGVQAEIVGRATQRLTGASQAPLGLISGGPAKIQYGLCYQPSGGGTIVNFVGGNYSYGEVLTSTQSFAGTATVVPGAGTWKVGFCVYNSSTSALDDNDFVNGWVQVTN